MAISFLRKGRVYQTSLKTRPCTEFSSEYLYRPLAHLVVRALLPLGFPPVLLVFTHTCLGIGCGFLIARGHFGWAAALIQLKTILDNADGQLARASGKVSDTGRYADTNGDLIVNGALFTGLAVTTDQPIFMMVALLILTLTLSCDFNGIWMYLRANNVEPSPPLDSSKEWQPLLRAVRRFYATVFAPQDRGIRQFSDHRFLRIQRQHPDAPSSTIQAARLAYHDRPMLWVLSNLELTTQLAVLGLCLWAGKPLWYPWFIIVTSCTIPFLQLRRERTARLVFASADRT